MVYSVGDGNIIVHDPKNLREEAAILSKLIYTANPQYVVSNLVQFTPFIMLSFGVHRNRLCYK